MAPVDKTTAEHEHRFHHYTGNVIPWYVRLIWVLFWVFAIYYTVRYLLPMIQAELVTAP